MILQFCEKINSNSRTLVSMIMCCRSITQISLQLSYYVCMFIYLCFREGKTPKAKVVRIKIVFKNINIHAFLHIKHYYRFQLKYKVYICYFCKTNRPLSRFLVADTFCCHCTTLRWISMKIHQHRLDYLPNIIALIW